jgi:hypothetical protein
MRGRSKASYRKRMTQKGRIVREPGLVPEGFAWCPDCSCIKPQEEFPRSKATKSGYGTYCKPCHNARSRETRERLYGGGRHYHLKRRYGISAAEADAMVEAQGGLCAICQERPAEHVDHDHMSGAVRGILCFTCNGGLGQFRDRVDIMRKAIDYLERTTWQRTLVAPGVYQLTSPRVPAAASSTFSLPPRPSSSRPG